MKLTNKGAGVWCFWGCVAFENLHLREPNSFQWFLEAAYFTEKQGGRLQVYGTAHNTG